MKNMFKNESFSKKLSTMFTNKALKSSSTCEDLYWQQAKTPKCLIDRELKKSNK